jgi:hypothetical protein
MNSSRISRIAVVCAGVVTVVSVARLPAQSPAAHPPVPIEITECVVYPEAAPDKTVDCAEVVRTACKAMSACDIRIGLALTGGRQIDGDERAWKKVRLRYRCADIAKVNGPYVQSEHATVHLSCD